MQAKLCLQMWLGERDPKKTRKPYLDNLPEGFDPLEVVEAHKNRSPPPSALVYEGKSSFKLFSVTLFITIYIKMRKG